ncbi:hypothetical protein GGX14DRAFT_353118 [Mycena pura]|uniref:Uncharacterized protein n=1 Tax=Mycena pura TaxID=153505 RepID=A0AAD6YLA8_9AGAR|nr:hypothetical protein GGX14DRAFT_353118 [Mycena pura]
MEVTTAIFATPTPSSSTPPPQTSRAAASLSQPPSTPSTAPPDPAPPVSTAAPPPRPPTAPPDPPPSTTAPPPPPSAVPPPPPQPLPAAAMSTASRASSSWFSEVYPEVSMHNLGENYNTLLAVWGKLERAYGYKKSAGIANWNVKAANRPLALQNWVKAGRGRKSSGNGAGPSIGDLAAFEAAWWQWWAGVQPDWRVKDAGRLQRFLRTTYPAPTAEAWAAMRHPGPNGALSFMATLYWWGKEVANNGGREERKSWTEAVCDVKWMLNGLLATEVEGKS